MPRDVPTPHKLALCLALKLYVAPREADLDEQSNFAVDDAEATAHAAGRAQATVYDFACARRDARAEVDAGDAGDDDDDALAGIGALGGGAAGRLPRRTSEEGCRLAFPVPPRPRLGAGTVARLLRWLLKRTAGHALSEPTAEWPLARTVADMVEALAPPGALAALRAHGPGGGWDPARRRADRHRAIEAAARHAARAFANAGPGGARSLGALCEPLREALEAAEYVVLRLEALEGCPDRVFDAVEGLRRLLVAPAAADTGNRGVLRRWGDPDAHGCATHVGRASAFGLFLRRFLLSAARNNRTFTTERSRT